MISKEFQRIKTHITRYFLSIDPFWTFSPRQIKNSHGIPAVLEGYPKHLLCSEIQPTRTYKITSTITLHRYHYQALIISSLWYPLSLSEICMYFCTHFKVLFIVVGHGKRRSRTRSVHRQAVRSSLSRQSFKEMRSDSSFYLIHFWFLNVIIYLFIYLCRLVKNILTKRYTF